MEGEDDVYLTGQDDGEKLPATAQRKQPSELDHLALYLQLKQWFLLDDAHSEEWRKMCREWHDFVAGDQWKSTTTKEMEGEGRVPLTFNYVGPFIDAVCGLEIGTRHNVTFLPRVIEPGDIIANEVIGGTSKWMGDNTNAPDEETEAFRSGAICGMGWIESRWSHDSEADGAYEENCIDALEMRWDRSARKKNLMDARRVWRVREMTLDEARDMFPDADDGDLNCGWASGQDLDGKTIPDEERRLKLENSHPNDTHSNVCIVHAQWIERECYYRVAMQDGLQEMAEQDYEALKKEAAEVGVKLKAIKQFRKVYKEAFVGSKILKVGPCPDPKRFTFRCITGKLHKTKGTFYGLVKPMVDPQRNANKWLSQALHILNATAKGGILAERGVFKNITDAQKSYNNPQAITVVEDGSIQKGRIMQKPGAGLATPYVQLVQHAVQAIPGVTGINLELLGMVDRMQPGILEAQRKQAGMTILAALFDALKLLRTENGKTRLHFMQHLMPDGQIMRVSGPKGQKAIRFIRDEHAGEYDVVVADAPTTTDEKERTWMMLMQMAQSDAMAQLLQAPEVVAEALNFCPLPTELVQLLQKAAASPKPEAQEQALIAKEDALSEIDKKKADAQLARAKTTLTLADAEVKRQQAYREEQIAAFTRAMRNAGMPGLPQGPKLIEHDAEEFAVSQMPSGLPTPQQLPEAPPEAGGFEGMAETGAPWPSA